MSDQYTTGPDGQPEGNPPANLDFGWFKLDRGQSRVCQLPDGVERGGGELRPPSGSGGLQDPMMAVPPPEARLPTPSKEDVERAYDRLGDAEYRPAPPPNPYDESIIVDWPISCAGMEQHRQRMPSAMAGRQPHTLARAGSRAAPAPGIPPTPMPPLEWEGYCQASRPTYASWRDDWRRSHHQYTGATPIDASASNNCYGATGNNNNNNNGNSKGIYNNNNNSSNDNDTINNNNGLSESSLDFDEFCSTEGLSSGYSDINCREDESWDFDTDENNNNNNYNSSSSSSSSHRHQNQDGFLLYKLRISRTDQRALQSVIKYIACQTRKNVAERSKLTSTEARACRSYELNCPLVVDPVRGDSHEDPTTECRSSPESDQPREKTRDKSKATTLVQKLAFFTRWCGRHGTKAKVNHFKYQNFQTGENQ